MDKEKRGGKPGELKRRFKRWKLYPRKANDQPVKKAREDYTGTNGKENAGDRYLDKKREKEET